MFRRARRRRRRSTYSAHSNRVFSGGRWFNGFSNKLKELYSTACLDVYDDDLTLLAKNKSEATMKNFFKYFEFSNKFWAP